MKAVERRQHYMKTNTNNERLQSCIFVDTETNVVDLPKGYQEHVLRFGWACFTQRRSTGEWTKPEWKFFTDKHDFWLWAMQHVRARVKTWVWCHNASFDFPVLDAFSELPDLGWKLHTTILGCPPLILKYRFETKTLMLVDTLNIFRMSLADLGKMVGLEKLSLPEQWGNQENDDAYCKRDVDIIRKAICDWSDFLRENDMGGFSPTLPSQAMRTFGHRYMRHRILLEANSISLGLARDCYHGGRCEAGYIGELTQPVHELDVNSMYPFVMSYAEMPIERAGVRTLSHVHQLEELLRKYCCCAHVRLNTPEPFAAVVHEEKLVFPVGVFDAYLCTPELKYALERGYIEEVHLVASYKKAVAFREFSLDLYERKRLAKEVGRLQEANQWKLILNSFYGKWGQRSSEWVELGSCDRKKFQIMPFSDYQTGEYSVHRYFGGVESISVERGESYSSHPAIAAHITAEARMILWTFIRKLAPEDYLYCDTDSLYVTDNGLNVFRGLLDDLKLGALKHVKTYEKMRIYGAKDVIKDGEQHTKGIRSNAEKLDENTYRQLRWFSLKGLLRKGRVNAPLTVPITKFLHRAYTKGTVLPSGYVAPLHFPLPKETVV